MALPLSANFSLRARHFDDAVNLPRRKRSRTLALGFLSYDSQNRRLIIMFYARQSDLHPLHTYSARPRGVRQSVRQISNFYFPGNLGTETGVCVKNESTTLTALGVVMAAAARE